MPRVYLDYAASAPLIPEVKSVIETFISTSPRPSPQGGEGVILGNPSSQHTEGRKSQGLLDRAITTVAAVFGVQPTEAVLTSGATESNNSLIQGVLRQWRTDHPDQKPHVVMSAVEHASWREVARAEDAEITIVPVSKDGVVAAEKVLAAITPKTALVGCMYVQNEIGVIQPVAEIGRGIQESRKHPLPVIASERSERGNLELKIATSPTAPRDDKREGLYPVFHVDAVQAFPYLNTHIDHINADSVTFSGHKYGALGGTGVLIIRNGTPWQSVVRGGNQQWGKRAGTENVLGALTLAAALEYCDTNREELTQHVTGLQKLLERELARRIPDINILAQHEPRSPHISYLWLPDLNNEHIVQKLDLAGIAVSSGSACSSGAQIPSNTLMVMGYSLKQAYGGIRVSYGRFTTPHEIGLFVEALEDAINQ